MDEPLDIDLRPFAPGDIDALYFLLRRCSPPEAAPAFGALLSTLLAPDTAAVVAELPGEVPPRLVGALVVHGAPWQAQAEVVGLLVHPDLRRQGLGRALMRWADRFARGFGWRQVTVLIAADDAGGAAFLAALGFAPLTESAAGVPRAPDGAPTPGPGTDTAAPWLPDGAPADRWRLTLDEDETP
ncbi:MAG: GNAT family N-acetyltransferase [Candidatus Lambdaproteobacteria bacterium]|nr:GNAT family N-acetyltransferase [Candidatus Lambdaproteobacteria bacterium]